MGMGLLDDLFSGSPNGGGLLDFLRNNTQNQRMDTPDGISGQYAQPNMPQAQQPIFSANQPSPLDNAQWPSGPIGAPSQANAQMLPQQPPPVIQAQPVSQPQPAPALPERPNPWLGNPDSFLNRVMGTDDQSIAQRQTLQAQNQTVKWLMQRGATPEAAMAAIANPKALEGVVKDLQQQPMNLGNGYLRDPNGKIYRGYEPEDKTPTSILEYKYYRENLPKGEAPMPYDVWSTAKARAGAVNISNNVDMNSGMTYDKQLAEGLGKSHATLANGVEDAQTRARDIAAMQGAVDAIQKNGGSTGGLAPQARLELQKSINAGAAAIGSDKPFNESDLADKEFLTKFNRSMAGAQAKNAVGSRVTNFEMSNFLKANPGLDMTLTGNQRLLGIQAQIEERNIAVGNAIRDATATAISQGKKIDPVTVQHIVAGYDKEHHIKDVVTGQDLTQSYALPEFQNANPTNASMSGAHTENLKTMEKTIGGKTYVQRDGQWYPK